ncbi:hypothetical protein V8F06_012163 [Rhypophila decipiens]
MSTTHKPRPTPRSIQSSVVAATINANNNSRYCVYTGRTTAAPQSATNRTSLLQTMSSPQSSHNGRGASQAYMTMPNLYMAESTDSEIDLDSASWMVTTVIEDDDLMFGGKPLSAWYEEDRRRLSTGDEEEEEEPRGRQRERVRVETVTHHHHYHHHHHTDGHRHQHHVQHHAKKGKEMKQ